MFKPSFPITKMLRAAKDAAEEKLLRTGKSTPKPIIEVLIFLLVFAAINLLQSFILTPFQLVALFQSDTFLSLIKNPTPDFATIMDAISSIQISTPSWLMIVQLFATSATIAVCIFYCRVIEKRNWLSLGFVKKGAIPEYVAGLGIGFILFGGAILPCIATGHLTLSVSSTPAVGMILLYFLGYVIQGMSEEILCRSYLMVSMQRGCPLWLAVITNALLFTSLHLGNPGVSPLALVNLSLFGIFASLYTLRRGSIWGIGAVHTIWNFVQGNIFGISVSGISGNPSVFHATLSESGNLIHGGAFGMEGGLAVTMILTIGCLILLLIKTKKSEIAEITP